MVSVTTEPGSSVKLDVSDPRAAKLQGKLDEIIRRGAESSVLDDVHEQAEKLTDFLVDTNDLRFEFDPAETTRFAVTSAPVIHRGD